MYVDLSFPIGHTFISVVDDKDVLHVYTYGQYGQGHPGSESTPTGKGALVHLVGDAATNYISDEFSHFKMKAYEIGKERVDKDKVMSYFDNLMKDLPQAEPDQKVIQYALNDPTGRSSAVQFGSYSGVTEGAGTGCGTDNCVTIADKAIQEGGSQALSGRSVPQSVNANLSFYSLFSLPKVTNVTGEVQNMVNSYQQQQNPKVPLKIETPQPPLVKSDATYVAPTPRRP